MSQNALTTTDPVLFESGGGLFKSKLRMLIGRFELTANHLVFYKRSYWWQMFGLIGALIGRKSAGKRDQDIALSTITAFARGKYGLNKKILDLTFADGGTLRLSIDKFDELTARLRDVLSQRARVVDQGEDRWQVVAA